MTEQIVAVRYRDIGCDQTEMYTAEELLHRKGVEFVIFGMLRVDTPEKVVIAQELCENGNYRGATTILRPLVLEVVPIAQWPLKKKRRRATKAGARATSAPTPPGTTPVPAGAPAPALPAAAQATTPTTVPAASAGTAAAVVTPASAAPAATPATPTGAPVPDSTPRSS